MDRLGLVVDLASMTGLVLYGTVVSKIERRGVVPPIVVKAVAGVILAIAAVVVHEYGLVGKGPDYVMPSALVAIDVVAVAALLGLDFWSRRHPSKASDEKTLSDPSSRSFDNITV